MSEKDGTKKDLGKEPQEKKRNRRGPQETRKKEKIIQCEQDRQDLLNPSRKTW